tara:strand:- start:1086 stop:1565 length:480 start_codon:yes stop_codon:yes gene_type:complete
MTLDGIKFPVYVIGTEDIETVDNIIFADGKVVDDKNMWGRTLGKRRLETDLPNLYSLRYMIKSKVGLIKHRGYMYIDSEGNLFSYKKENFFPLKYHKIRKVDMKDVVSLLWLNDINFPIEIERPPAEEYTWAGVIYKGTVPWFFWEYSTEWKKDTRRKI